jgi:NDP-sugar pyrophosphorylase family protein
MLVRVLENFYQSSNIKFTVCILYEHEKNFKLIHTISGYTDIPINFVIIDKLQDGPAKTCYLAKDSMNLDIPLIITNCDQIIFDLDVSKMASYAVKNKADGILGTFYSNSPKNSYVRLNDEGEVTQVREKEVISNYATNGVHFWSKGSYFFDSCDRMFSKNDRVNNEFYVAPSYNYMTNNGQRVLQYFFNEHFPIGIPSDLEKFKKLDYKWTNNYRTVLKDTNIDNQVNGETFNEINWKISPWNFPDPIYTIVDYDESYDRFKPYPYRTMELWSKEQLRSIL